MYPPQNISFAIFILNLCKLVNTFRPVHVIINVLIFLVKKCLFPFLSLFPFPFSFPFSFSFLFSFSSYFFFLFFPFCPCLPFSLLSPSFLVLFLSFPCSFPSQSFLPFLLILVSGRQSTPCPPPHWLRPCWSTRKLRSPNIKSDAIIFLPEPLGERYEARNSYPMCRSKRFLLLSFFSVLCFEE